jgi:glucosamine--fructose-6-phosphate aminotransferase (isomerizing)
LVKAQAAFAESDGARLALVNDVISPLAAGADIVLDQHAGEEHSTAATKSVGCPLLAIDLLAEALSGHVDRLEARGIAVARVVAKATASPDLTVIETIESAYVIGRGASLPMAIEAALKLKEIALPHAEALRGRGAGFADKPHFLA